MQQWLNFLTLLGAVQGIFFSAVLLGSPNGKRVAIRFLALFLLMFSFSMLGITAYFSRWILQYPHLGLLHVPLGAVLGVPFLLYLLAISRKNFQARRQHVLLFLPAVVVLIWLMPFYLLGAEEKRRILEGSYSRFPDTWRYIFIFSNLVNFVCLIASWLVVVRHERAVRQVYSSSLHRTLVWTRSFLLGGMVIFFTCVILSAWNINWADAWSNLMFSLLIYVFGYRAMRQPEIFNDIPDDAMPGEEQMPLVLPARKYEKSNLTEQQAEVLLRELDRLMADEHLYLDPELKLHQLAARLRITPHQTSQLLNRFKGEGFSDFVNRHRVEHFKKAIQDASNGHLSVLAVAFDSGFNSKAAFNAVFKKLTGQTPSQLRSIAPQQNPR